MSRLLPARALLGALLVASALLVSGPAAADDIYEIDARLQDAGFPDAYVEAFDAFDVDGVRVTVDFTSDSATAASYEVQAQELARLVWLNLDGRVLAVDVLPLATTDWSPETLPPGVSFTRAELQEAHGPRPTGLDATDVESVDDLGGAFGGGFGWFVGGVALLFWLLSVGAAVAITALVVRRRQPEPWGGYGTPAPGPWGGPGPPAGPPLPQQLPQQPQHRPAADIWQAPGRP